MQHDDSVLIDIVVLYIQVVAVSLEIFRERGKPMDLLEVLTFGIFLVDLIGLVYKISKKK